MTRQGQREINTFFLIHYKLLDVYVHVEFILTFTFFISLWALSIKLNINHSQSVAQNGSAEQLTPDLSLCLCIA